ncbi:hypothetical protein IscW_ISCW012571 [Ixodes scapularis]|uniref:Uncharacterized protein n=1 Tax=Ixodes scapularis TaxID=6945 RepID=B7QBX7_IXOSC|nr:hypothetical protein IscW_ISCW012571 [Ixodes scapularis]|eukprot:XP_002413041.1 hypothetical protein IscW_ISCW012571 [Ixodes scapularis]
MRHRSRRLPSNTTLRPGKRRLAPLARLDSTLVFGVLRFAGAVPKPGRRRDERKSRMPTRLEHRRASVANLLVGDDPRRTFSSTENLARDVLRPCATVAPMPVGRTLEREAATALSTTPPLDDTG